MSSSNIRIINIQALLGCHDIPIASRFVRGWIPGLFFSFLFSPMVIMRSVNSVLSLDSNITTCHEIVGQLLEENPNGNLCNSTAIYADEEIIIGRDPKRCQVQICDSSVSNRHIRIHTILYEREDMKEDDRVYEALVFAEDISLNGTFLNGSLMGPGRGGYLLSSGDVLRISAGLHVRFIANIQYERPVSLCSWQEEEIKHFRNRYVVTPRQLGAGSFGRVHLAFHTYSTNHTQYACKIVDLRKFKQDPRISESFSRAGGFDKNNELMLRNARLQCQREVEILEKLEHPNIVGLEKAFFTSDTIYLFEELVAGGDLFSYLESKGGILTELETMVVVYQIVIGLEYLHEKNIVHRDLKLENVLLTSKSVGCRVVISDFGCATQIAYNGARMSTFMGTVQYAAPELLQAREHPGEPITYSQAVDLWALGCITTTLVMGRSPFAGPQGEFDEALARACDMSFIRNFHRWQGMGSRLMDFIEGLLYFDAASRMTAKQAVNHRWFTAKAYRIELEKQYQRSIRHWKPRRTKQPVFETFNGGALLKPTSLMAPKGNQRSKHVSFDPLYNPLSECISQTFLLQGVDPLTRQAQYVTRMEPKKQTTLAMPKTLPDMSTQETRSSKRRVYSPDAWCSETGGIVSSSSGANDIKRYRVCRSS